MRKLITQNKKRVLRSQNKKIYFNQNPQEKAKIQLLQLSKFPDNQQKFETQCQIYLPQINQYNIQVAPKTAKSQNLSSLKNKANLDLIRNKIYSNRYDIDQKNQFIFKNFTKLSDSRQTKTRPGKFIGYYQTPSLKLYNNLIIDQREIVNNPNEIDFYFDQKFYTKRLLRSKKQVNPFSIARQKQQKTKNRAKSNTQKIKYRYKI